MPLVQQRAQASLIQLALFLSLRTFCWLHLFASFLYLTSQSLQILSSRFHLVAQYLLLRFHLIRDDYLVSLTEIRPITQSNAEKDDGDNADNRMHVDSVRTRFRPDAPPIILWTS